MPRLEFELALREAGYEEGGTAPAEGNRVKGWWMHSTYRRVEVIYSPDKSRVITAYHPS